IIHNVLITNLQLWRVLWVTNLASNAAILLLLIRVDKARRMPLAIAVVFSLLPGLLLSLDMTAPFVVLLCLLWYLHRNFRNNRIRLLAASAILIPMAFVLALAVYSLYLQLTLDRYIVRHVLDLALLTAAAFGLIWYVRHPQNKLIIVVSVGILASSMLVADQRSSWNRYVYGSSQDITLNQFLANAGTTFWEGENGTELLWFKERKPSYFSCMQAAESVFFQAVAAEWSRRKSALQLLHTVGFSDESCTSIFSGTNSKVEVEAVCQSLPDLDTIVLNHPVPELPNRTWTAPTYQEVMESKKTGNAIKKKLVKISAFYRYDCATLRESP
ncbi:hypothetical protein, partial [Castellaniella sp.]|uniref:hypothetical protein n=1 Tax=Castellaniella sp. TaxID=1955812 RepID=UPI0025B7F63D